MIYCVEDDSSIRDIEVYALRSTGYEAEGLCDGRDLFAAIKRQLPELILLDIMLPGEDGVSILKQLKSKAITRDIPVIMATAKGAEFDKIVSLDLGADDYLVKPFGMMELVSRVRAVLRRSMRQMQKATLELGGIRLDTDAHSVYADGGYVELTIKEFDLLNTLMSRPGMVFTRDRLLNDIWGMDYDGETRTVDVHIRTLRAKLGSCGDNIRTVRGLGYKIEIKE